MIDFLITQHIVSSAKDEDAERSVAEVVLVVTYLVLVVAAVVSAALMRARKTTDGSTIVLATLSPLIYFLLLPFGVLDA